MVLSCSLNAASARRTPPAGACKDAEYIGKTLAVGATYVNGSGKTIFSFALANLRLDKGTPELESAL